MKISPNTPAQSAYAHEARTKQNAMDKPSKEPSAAVDRFTPSGEVPETAAKPALVTLQSIQKEIKQQAYTLLQQQAAKSGDPALLNNFLTFDNEEIKDNADPLGLGAYFTANPEDWEQVQNGIVPDHFNMENTGQRILDIWMGGIDESGDISAQVDEIKSNINMAYGDVSSMLGGLPGLVTDTQDWIMGQLDDFVERKTTIE